MPACAGGRSGRSLGALVRLRRVLWDPGARRLYELLDEIWQRGGVVAIFEEDGVRAVEEELGAKTPNFADSPPYPCSA
jgi:hypothetical protein